MFKALLRTQFASIWAALFRNSTGAKKKSAGKAVLVGILFIYRQRVHGPAAALQRQG